MIGAGYWSAGIVIYRRSTDGRDWSVSLKFYDSGFAQDQSTEGELRVRYLAADLDAAVDTLKADADRLGIVWFRTPGDDAFLDRCDTNGTPAGGPTVYYDGDGETASYADQGDDARRIANHQARRIGGTPIYKGGDSLMAVSRDTIAAVLGIDPANLGVIPGPAPLAGTMLLTPMQQRRLADILDHEGQQAPVATPEALQGLEDRMEAILVRYHVGSYLVADDPLTFTPRHFVADRGDLASDLAVAAVDHARQITLLAEANRRVDARERTR